MNSVNQERFNRNAIVLAGKQASGKTLLSDLISSMIPPHKIFHATGDGCENESLACAKAWKAKLLIFREVEAESTVYKHVETFLSQYKKPPFRIIIETQELPTTGMNWNYFTLFNLAR